MEGQFESDKQQILPPQYTANTTVCTGQQLMPGTQTIIHVNNSVPSPPDYFGLSLFVTICCCLPFGIVALVKSSEVRTRAAMGDIAGAELSSSEARKWSRAGLYTGIGIASLSALVYVVIFIVGIVSINSPYGY